MLKFFQPNKVLAIAASGSIAAICFTRQPHRSDVAGRHLLTDYSKWDKLCNDYESSDEDQDDTPRFAAAGARSRESSPSQRDLYKRMKDLDRKNIFALNFLDELDYLTRGFSFQDGRQFWLKKSRNLVQLAIDSAKKNAESALYPCRSMKNDEAWTYAQTIGIQKCDFDYWWQFRVLKVQPDAPEVIEGWNRFEIEAMRWQLLVNLGKFTDDGVALQLLCCDTTCIRVLEHLSENKSNWPFCFGRKVPNRYFEKVKRAVIACDVLDKEL